MKLRIHGNAVRVRLNQAEVAQFSKTGFIEESTEFAGCSRLTVVLECFSRLESFEALYENGAIRIRIPRKAVQEWCTSDLVGISGQQTIGGGQHLSILVEKDFRCAHSPHPQDPHAYPNPLEDATYQAE